MYSCGVSYFIVVLVLLRNLTVPEITSQMFSPSNLMAAADPRMGKFLTGSFHILFSHSKYPVYSRKVWKLDLILWVLNTNIRIHIVSLSQNIVYRIGRKSLIRKWRTLKINQLYFLYIRLIGKQFKPSSQRMK